LQTQSDYPAVKIGLLSDTHGFLDPRVFDYFAECDEIWHAGDIGSTEVADALENFKTFRAVHGNIDDPAMRRRYPEDLWFDCEGILILMTHIAGSPPRFNPRVKKLLAERKPGVLVCGHSHILRVMKDEATSVMYLNPGAAGHHGLHPIRTMLRFEAHEGRLARMEVIELGKRGLIEPTTTRTD
jgi:putative phosphoesterase